MLFLREEEVMKKFRLEGAIALLACFLFLAGAANAAVVYDNLGSLNAGADPIYSFGPLYDSFSTGASGFSLASVQLLLNASQATGSISVALYQDNATSPGVSLTTIGVLNDSALTSALSVFGFALSTPYALAPNTRYWLGVSSGNGSSANWGWSLDQAATGVAGEYFANQNGVFPNSGGPYQMRLSDMAPVPVPGALLLFGPGLAGLAAIRRRFKR
jgi:hypothetical protein